MLQRRHRVGRPGVGLAAQAVGVLAADIEGVAVDRRVAEGVAVTARGLLRDLRHADALDGRGRAEEVAADEGRVQADRVEDLRAAVGLVGGDAHLGHHLQQALIDRLDVAVDDLVVGEVRRELVLHVEQRLEGEVRVDRLGAVAGEAREVVHLARLAGLDHEAYRGPESLADQVVVHGGRGQQRRDRDPVRPDRPVGEHDDVVAAAHRRLGAVAEPVERPVHGRRAGLGRVGHVECLGVEPVLEMPDRADLLQIRVGQDRLADLQALAPGRTLHVEQVRPRPDERDEAHDGLLADRVDRRVRDLREVLLEVGVEELRLLGERRERRVRAHRADRLLAGDGHGLHEQLEVFLRVAEGLLAIEQADVAPRLARLHRAQILQHDLGVLHPVGVGVRGGQLALDLLVRDDAALLEVDQQHAARLEAPGLDDLLVRDRQGAHLGSEHHEAVVGHDVPRRAQAVAVQGRADLAAVREGHGGRAVPRLHQGSVILVEGASLLAHQRVAGPGLRDEHHHRVGERVAALHEELEGVVEAGGVGLPLVGDRPQLRDVVAEQVGIDARLAGRHPVDVAAQRVDLAVMRDHPVRVREPPRREGIGGEALVHEGDRRDEAVVLQVEEVAAELRDQHHALVDDGPGRHGDRVELLHPRVVEAVDLVGDHLAGDVDPALERVLVGDRGGPADEHLTVMRLGGLHGVAEILRVHRHVAPAEERKALGGQGRFDDLLDDRPGLLRLRHEELPDGVRARGRKLEAETRALLREEAVRDLREDAAAVTHLGIGAHRAAVIEVLQDLQTLLDDRVGAAVVHVGDEADTAGVALVSRIVGTLGFRKSGVAHDERHGAAAGGGSLGRGRSKLVGGSAL